MFFDTICKIVEVSMSPHPNVFICFTFLSPFLENVLGVENLHGPSPEVYYPLQTQRRERIKYTSNQLRELESAFAINRYLTSSERDQLATKLGVTESRIQVHLSAIACENMLRSNLPQKL